MATIMHNPWNIFEKSASSDVGEAVDALLLNKRQERANVDPCRLEQHVAKRLAAGCRRRFRQIPPSFLDDPPYEREAVAVHARTCQPKGDVTWCDRSAGKHLVALDGA